MPSVKVLTVFGLDQNEIHNWHHSTVERNYKNILTLTSSMPSPLIWHSGTIFYFLPMPNEMDPVLPQVGFLSQMKSYWSDPELLLQGASSK